MSEILFNTIGEFKKCMNTITENDGLLDKRGYQLHEKFNDLDFNEYNNFNSIELMGQKPNSDTYCFMYFVNNTSFLSKSYKTKSENNINKVEENIRKLYNIDNNKEIDINLIIILTQPLKINSYILEKKIIEKIDIENIQIFTYANLLFNITKHSKIPKHIRVISDKNEIKELCELKNISGTDKLPKILLSDPLANFYGLRVGELFEFKKYSKNSGIYIYYRVCVI
jgi:DNA-directed RNA polymerase subunit H (RpoH/RPB5)